MADILDFAAKVKAQADALDAALISEDDILFAQLLAGLSDTFADTAQTLEKLSEALWSVKRVVDAAAQAHVLCAGKK